MKVKKFDKSHLLLTANQTIVSIVPVNGKDYELSLPAGLPAAGLPAEGMAGRFATSQ